MNVQRSLKAEKSRRYRARKKDMGLKQVRLWVPDVHAPGFREKLAADMRALRDEPDERSIMEFTEALRTEVWKDLD